MIRHYLWRTFILSFVFGMTIFLLPYGVFAQTEVYVDIKPGGCPNPINLKSQGVVPVAILGTVDFDVTTIDPASIELYYGDILLAQAFRSSIEDVATPFIPTNDPLLCEDCDTLGPDGYDDLTVKFRTEEINAALLAEIDAGNITLNDGDCITLTITGVLLDNETATIIGGDVVRILMKGKTPVRNRNGHLNRHRHIPTE